MSDANNEPQPVETEDSDKKVLDSDNEDEDLDALLDGKNFTISERMRK